MTTTETLAIDVTGLEKTLGAFHLGPIDLRLPTGYVTGFAGANGAGKTTTIKSLLGMIHPDAGAIGVLGRPVGPGMGAVHDRVGVVLDQPFLVPDWTVKDAAGAIAPFYRAWDAGRFGELLRRFEITTDVKVKDLSRGQGTKLMIALALAHDPDLLILDEPTSGLDPVARADLLDLFRDFMTDERHSILFSTHITSDLEKIADYVHVIRAGRLAYSGTCDGLAERYGVVRGGLDDLTPANEPLIHGLRRTLTGFDGLIDMSDSAQFGPGAIIEPPTIDDVVTRLGATPAPGTTR